MNIFSKLGTEKDFIPKSTTTTTLPNEYKNSILEFVQKRAGQRDALEEEFAYRCVMIGDYIYLFGGVQDFQISNIMLSFNMTKKQWSIVEEHYVQQVDGEEETQKGDHKAVEASAAELSPSAAAATTTGGHLQNVVESFRWKLMVPSARADFSMYATSNRTIVMFGGCNMEVDLADVWKLKVKHYENKVVCYWMSLPPSYRARNSHASCYDSKHDKMYIHGGLGIKDEFLSDLAVFNYRKKTWKEIKLKNEIPNGTRYGHQLICLPSDATNQLGTLLLLFGGLSKSQTQTLYLGDLHIVNVKQKMWISTIHLTIASPSGSLIESTTASTPTSPPCNTNSSSSALFTAAACTIPGFMDRSFACCTFVPSQQKILVIGGTRNPAVKNPTSKTSQLGAAMQEDIRNRLYWHDAFWIHVDHLLNLGFKLLLKTCPSFQDVTVKTT